MLIYRVINKINGKCYIGQTTKTLEERRKQHRWGNQLLHKAIHKYGENNFIWEIVDNTIKTYNELLAAEVYYIKKYNSYCKLGGYNLTLGGEGCYGRECGDDTKNKISESMKGKDAWNKGLTKDTDDRVASYSNKLVGHVCNDKTKKKMSKSASQRCDQTHKNRFNNIMSSEEVKKKRSATIKENGSFSGSNNPRYNTSIDNDKIIELYGTMPVSKIATILEYPLTTTYRRVKLLKQEGKV